MKGGRGGELSWQPRHNNHNPSGNPCQITPWWFVIMPSVHVDTSLATPHPANDSLRQSSTRSQLQWREPLSLWNLFLRCRTSSCLFCVPSGHKHNEAQTIGVADWDEWPISVGSSVHSKTHFFPATFSAICPSWVWWCHLPKSGDIRCNSQDDLSIIHRLNFF